MALTRQEAVDALAGMLDDEALRFLTLALRGVLEGPAGYGSVEVLISDSRVTYVNFSTRIKVNREILEKKS